MEKIKSIVVIVFFGYGLHQLINGNIWSSIVTAIVAVMLFLALLRGWDYFGEHMYVLSLIVLFISIIDIASSSNAFNMDNITKQNEVFMRSVEARYCPVSHQPNERKRMAFNELSEKLNMSCLQQGNRDILKLHVDLSKAVYLDPVVGTVDSFYNEFFSKKDTPITCMDLAQKMDLLCPGLLEL